MPKCRNADSRDDVPAANGTDVHLRWDFSIVGEPPEPWSWSERGTPPLDQLGPVRQPRSSEHHRHVPVTAYSMTNGGSVYLESGLEHDLFRRLDRDLSVVHLVAQPFKLSWSGSVIGNHTPDLLALRADAVPTVWDVRAPEEQDQDFCEKSAITRRACTLVGWRYAIFAGMAEIERLNMMFLYGFRRRPPWTARNEDQVRVAVGPDGSTLADVFAQDDGSGELISTVWHLLWRNALRIDITAPWTLDTAITLNKEYANDERPHNTI